MTVDQTARACAIASLALEEARRVFGPTAEVHYGVSCGAQWATAGVNIDAEDSPTTNEISVWCGNPLERLYACLSALPGASP